MTDNVKLYQYVVIYNPTKEEVKEGEKPKIIVDITNVLAKNEKVVMMDAARSIPTDFIDRLENVEIAIRPF